MSKNLKIGIIGSGIQGVCNAKFDKEININAQDIEP